MIESPDEPSWEQHQLPIIAGVLIFCVFSIWGAVTSEGFLEADAITHYLYARFAFQEPHYLLNVWGRPLCTGLYAVPAALFGRIGVRMMSLLLALLVSWTAFKIAKGQKHRWPALAVMFTLCQPMLFLHSFSELTELPFAAVLGLAFLAYQRRRFALMAILIGISPAGRPEGFGFIAMATAGLLLHRNWKTVPLLFLPLGVWTYLGWFNFGCPPYDSSLPFPLHGLLWLKHAWPYAGDSLYDRGHLFKYVALLPAIVSPFVFPAVLMGMWRSLRPAWWAEFFPPLPLGEGRGGYEGKPDRTPPPPSPTPLPKGEGFGRNSAPQPVLPLEHLFAPMFSAGQRGQAIRCEALIAVIPLLILIGHSLLHALGKMASSGEMRYLLIVAPFWGLLASRGWEWIVPKLDLRHPLRYAAILALLPCLMHVKLYGLGVVFGYRVLPLTLSDDMLYMKEFASWYDNWPLREKFPRLMAAHPGVFYFMDMSMTDRRAVPWEKAVVTSPPEGVVSLWDPVYGHYNADARKSVVFSDFDQNGWVRLHPVREIPEDPSTTAFLSPQQADGSDTPYESASTVSWSWRDFFPSPSRPK